MLCSILQGTHIEHTGVVQHTPCVNSDIHLKGIPITVSHTGIHTADLTLLSHSKFHLGNKSFVAHNSFV